MAGHRRAAGKPMVRTIKSEKRVANRDSALASVRTPQDKVGVACDHLRWVLTRNPDEAVAEEVVLYLIQVADRLHKKTGPTR